MELIGLGNNDVKNNEKQSRRAAAQKRDDFMMNRLMILLAGVIVVIVLLLYLRRDSRDFDVVFINKVLPWKMTAGTTGQWNFYYVFKFLLYLVGGFFVAPFVVLWTVYKFIRALRQ